MNIIVPIKVLADDQDIVVAADRSLDDSKAHRIVSTYDLNAIEAAVQLASAHADSKVVCVSVADAKADDSKLKKGILARGVDELVMIADDACADLDAHATAATLAPPCRRAGRRRPHRVRRRLRRQLRAAGGRAAGRCAGPARGHRRVRRSAEGAVAHVRPHAGRRSGDRQVPTCRPSYPSRRTSRCPASPA